MKYLLLLLVVITLSSCDEVKNWVGKGDSITIIPNTTTELSPPANNTPVQQPLYFDGNLSYYVAEDTFVIMSNNSVIVIDSGKYSAVEILKKFNAKPNAFIVTLSSDDKSFTARYFIMSMKPKVVLDNGLPTERRKSYMEYADRLGITSDRITSHRVISFTDIDLEFFVPFEDGFFTDDMNKNSLVVKANDVLYMSNCNKECEKRVDTDARVIILANSGRCPTSSMDFILDTGAEEVVGTELCPELDDLRYFGVKYTPIVGTIKLT